MARKKSSWYNAFNPNYKRRAEDFKKTFPTLPSDERLIVGMYRVTIQLVQNLRLTSRQKFRFGLVCPGLARAKRNFCFTVNGRF